MLGATLINAAAALPDKMAGRTGLYFMAMNCAGEPAAAAGGAVAARLRRSVSCIPYRCRTGKDRFCQRWSYRENHHVLNAMSRQRRLYGVLPERRLLRVMLRSCV